MINTSATNLKVKIYNIGKFVKDSLWVSVKLKLPNDSIISLFKKLIPGFNNVYTQAYFPVNPYLLDTNIQSFLLKNKKTDVLIYKICHII